jgi:hypothetical protein
MLEAVKLALRIKSNAYDQEITDLIGAAKRDMLIRGVEVIDESDDLIGEAIKMYSKANFGNDNPYAEKWKKAYEDLRDSLALSGHYNVEAIE